MRSSTPIWLPKVSLTLGSKHLYAPPDSWVMRWYLGRQFKLWTFRFSEDSWLLHPHCAVLAHQSSCGVLRAVSELWRVSWIRWSPLWLVCAPQHVSTIGCSLPPPPSGSHPPLCPSSHSFTLFALLLPPLHRWQASWLFRAFCVHFSLSSSPKTWTEWCQVRIWQSPWQWHPGDHRRQILGLI